MKHRILALATAATVAASGAAFAAAHANNYEVELTQLYAVTQPGAPDPAGDETCKTDFGQHVGQTLSGSYSIDTTTLKMSATAVFLGTEVTLFPLGISGTFAFMSDGVPAALEAEKVNRIVVNVSTDMEKVEGDVLFVTGGEFNCVLSNLPASNM